MKPCIECGLAIHNNATICAECNAVQKVSAESTQTLIDNSDAENPDVSRSMSLFLLEIFVRTAMVGMLPVCILIAVLYFLLPLKYAILVGVMAGLLFGFAYSLLEMYFQNGP